MDTYTHDNFTFDVTDSGPPDGRVVLALHGFPEDRGCWNAIGTSLAGSGYRMLAPDQRGYSPGARPEGRRAYRLSELDGDVMALADAVGVRRFDLVGHDLGAAVAWDVAYRYPERVRSLTVLSVPHPSAFLASMGHSSQLLHSWYMGFFQIPRLPEALLGARGGRLMVRMLERDGLDRGSASRYAGRAAASELTGPINWYRALALSARERTGTVRVPTLYVWSDGDRYLTRKSAEMTGRYVAGPYRFEVLAGERHWLPSAAADRVAPLLLEHLESVPA